jgi:WD40 repeat protein
MGKNFPFYVFRIIKIWDRETMVLQASLHSHTDYITDLDVSKCNRYFASSSKDGKVIVWDLMKCKKLDEISAHQSSVNNIKFFTFKDKKDPRSQPF